MTQFLKLIQSVSDQILSKKLLKPNQLLLVTVSGGQDSVCLFLILFHLKKQWKWKIHIVYCNHLWQTDSFFIMKQLVKFTKLFQTPLYLAVTSINLLNEKDARNWRYSIFYRIGLFLTPSSFGLKMINIYDFQRLQVINSLKSKASLMPHYLKIEDFKGPKTKFQKEKMLVHKQIMIRGCIYDPRRPIKQDFNKTLFYYRNSTIHTIHMAPKIFKEIGLNGVHLKHFTTYGSTISSGMIRRTKKNPCFFLKENPSIDLSFLPHSDYPSLVGPFFWPLGQILFFSKKTLSDQPLSGYKKSTWLVQTKRITRDRRSVTPLWHKKTNNTWFLEPHNGLYQSHYSKLVLRTNQRDELSKAPKGGLKRSFFLRRPTKDPQSLYGAFGPFWNPYNRKIKKFTPQISLVTGHTLNDKVETLLFNMIRGCGLNGIYSLRWKRYIKSEKYKKILLNEISLFQIHSRFFIINNKVTAFHFGSQNYETISGDYKRIPIPSIFP